MFEGVLLKIAHTPTISILNDENDDKPLNEAVFPKCSEHPKRKFPTPS